MRAFAQFFVRPLALILAVAALTFGLAKPPTAAAADLNFTGTTLSGGTFNGSSLQGKPAVLWFWTPWCPFCNAEAPIFSASVASRSAAPPSSSARAQPPSDAPAASASGDTVACASRSPRIP
jgi:hypothetical protein